MTGVIRFGGPGAAAGTMQPGGGPTSASGLLQEFMHYVGKVWLEGRELAQDSESLARFDIDHVIAAYRRHRAAGREIPLDEGLGLEESCLLAQIFARRPLRCLLNSAMPKVPTDRIQRVARRDPADLVEDVRRRWKIDLSFGSPIGGQLERWGGLAPAFTALVYDGFSVRHCILLRGFEKRTGCFLYWDPWPLLSLLCAENNDAGVAARLVDDEHWLWALESASMQKVLFAVFVPA